MPFDSLRDAIARYTATHTESPEGGYPTAIPSLLLARYTEVAQSHRTLYTSAGVCLIAQGAKQVVLGADVLRYRAGKFAVIGVDLPVSVDVTEASQEEPYLAVVLGIDPVIMREVIEAIGDDGAPPEPDGAGYFVGDVPPEAAECAARMVRLLDAPKAIPVLYPSMARELYYWLVTSTHGAPFRQLVSRNGYAERISRAIRVIREELRQPIPIERLAAVAGMSESSFHVHFKALTTMSPLQYQKHLRLLRARHLLVTSEANASEAAYQVGYASPSQFSREYSRMFGYPPSRESVAAHSPAEQAAARRAP
ncbi:AraC family transcriptional regulator [Pendulispora brunnea]|uniref:AraC family transcriptional regulator n=1 Tax=Pendulispora brunnea TaxID=2905690 RepID=A0ABZ2KRN5_9BACT